MATGTNRSKRALASTVLVLAIATLCPSARAEDASPSTKAGALIDEGVELRVQGDERAALERFRRAYELDPSPRAVAQMGLAEKSLRRYLAAEQHLLEALSHGDDPWVSGNREALEAAGTLVAKHLGWLAVTTNIQGAELLVNGAPVGALPLDPQRVVAGQTVVEVKAHGYETQRREQAVPAEVTTAVGFELAKVEPPPPPAVIPATSPMPPPALTPPGEAPMSWTPFIIGTGSLAVVGLGIGTGLGVRALQLRSERDEICPEASCETQEGVEVDESGRAMATGSTVAFTFGGLAAGAALVLWLVEPDTDVVSAQGTGVAVRF
jgi:PEGA domain